MRQSSPSAIWGNLEVSLRRWGEHRVVGGARGCGRGGVVQRCASAPVSMAAGVGLGWALRLQGGQGERAGSRHLSASHTSAPSCIYLSSGLRTWGVSVWMVRKWEQQCRSSSHFPQGSLLLLSPLSGCQCLPLSGQTPRWAILRGVKRMHFGEKYSPGLT